MDPRELQRIAGEVERFDAGAPIGEARTPPASWYLDPAFFHLEQVTVFARNWLVACRAEQVREPGDYVAGSTGWRRRHVVVRGEDGELRAFHNVCRHHAALLVSGSGRCRRLVCPYHGWSYGLDGALLAAPRAGDVRSLPAGDRRLQPLAVARWGPLVFVAGTEARASDLRARLAGLEELERACAGLVFVQRLEYRLLCNWKVFVDNYLDGGYHVPRAHRGLAQGLEMGSYTTEVGEGYVLQSARGRGGERLGERAVYAWIHPTTMLNRYGPVLDVNVVVPVGVEETVVVFDFWMEPAAAADRGFVAACLRESERVQREDMELCASVQQGLASAAFDGGAYVAGVEEGELAFHRRLAAELKEGIEDARAERSAGGR